MTPREIADEFDGMSTRDLEQLAEMLRKELEKRAVNRAVRQTM